MEPRAEESPPGVRPAGGRAEGGQETDCSAIGGQLSGHWSGRCLCGGVGHREVAAGPGPELRVPQGSVCPAHALLDTCHAVGARENKTTAALGPKREGLQCPLLTELSIKPLQGETLSESRLSSQSRYSRVNLEQRGNTLGAVTEVHSENSPVSTGLASADLTDCR